jgi:hypothetical protein
VSGRSETPRSDLVHRRPVFNVLGRLGPVQHATASSREFRHAIRRLASAPVLVVALLCAARAIAADDAVDLGKIEGVGTMPLPGVSTPLDQVPSNVQTFGSRDLARQRTGGVAEFLNLNSNSLSLNSPTGNSFQPDVSFRGFTASSLLGTPQGLPSFRTACASTRPSPTS